MKEKKLKEISPFEGVAATFSAMRDITLGGGREWRNDKFREEGDGFIVDTCMGFDTGTWETGISQNGEGSWTIVEQYADRDEAEIGHAKWAELMLADPTRELEDINIWGI